MTKHVAFIIGYAVDDMKRHQMLEYTILAGRCGSCRKNTFLNQSGIDTLRARDCAVFCYDCAVIRNEYDYMIMDIT